MGAVPVAEAVAEGQGRFRVVEIVGVEEGGGAGGGGEDVEEVVGDGGFAGGGDAGESEDEGWRSGHCGFLAVATDMERGG